MKFLNLRVLRFLLPLCIFILGCPPSAPPPANELPNEDVTTGITWAGAFTYLAPASQAAFLVQLHAPYGNQPLAAAPIEVTLHTPTGASRQLFHGKTDEQGVIRVAFKTPDDLPAAHYELRVAASVKEYGFLQRTAEVYIGRVYNILVSTDKPVYQPGQTIHVRSLALDAKALQAAQWQPLLVTVSDPQGNKLMRTELTTSDYGVASTDFVLDTQATSGDYTITAEMGAVTSSRTVEVKPYNLPRFAVNFQRENSFYQPGAVVTGTVDAHYFFGKPVAGATVSIKGFVTDVERVQLFEVTGVTDETGSAPYSFETPAYLAGNLDNDTATIDLEITVTDTANHSEQIEEGITVAAQPILIDAVAEAGVLRAGLENIVYLQSSYPDGRPAATTMTVTGDISPTQVVTTDLYGLATLTVTPASNRNLTVVITATDDQAQMVQQELTLESTGMRNTLLLRPDRAQYRIGETLNIDIHVQGEATTVYLDVVKDGQTFALAPLPVTNGLAQAAIDLDGSLLGTLELHGYLVTDRGELIRDRRLILINPAPATVAVTTDAEVYRPGDTATLAITVQQEQAGLSSVLGVSIVDESVFALGGQDPGFARTYFLLERELQEPRYEIHEFAPLGDDDPSSYDKTASTAHQRALAGFFGEELAALTGSVPPASTAVVVPLPLARAWGWLPRVALVTPLLGFAFYDGTRRRRRLLLGLVIVSAAIFWTSCAAAPGGAPAAEMAAAPAEEAAVTETTATRGEPQAAPRLRQFFPETLFWLPELLTDADGHAQIEVPLADSITTWRISVLASDQQGNLGSAQVGLRVFQDFFVEPDLPRFLTVGDEIAVPVSLFNYLDEPQTIQLDVAAADWFELVDNGQGLTTTVTLAANEVSAVYIPIRVTGFGQHDFQITATGSTMSDAIRKQVEVRPDGQATTTAVSGKLAPTHSFTVTVPENAVPGTAQVTVKVYGGIISQLVGGLAGMLQEPYGCFEQTSSTTYPNVLVLDYLKTTGQANPNLQLQAEHYINLGYQRLLSFEVNGMPGGFSLFGEPPAQTMLTAYGLMEFSDMQQVSYVDPALIERTAAFLFQRQQADGAWEPMGMTIESGLEGLGDNNLLPTAYVLWALADAGYADREEVQRGVDYMLGQLSQFAFTTGQRDQPASPLAAPRQALDPYAAALIANALIAAAPDAATLEIDQLLDQLVTSAGQDTQGYYSWNSGMSTYMGGYGNISRIETAAMTAIALIRRGQQLDVAQGALDWLISQRDPNGMFYSTQTTVLALKALLLAAKEGGEGGDAAVTITLNGGQAQTIAVNDANNDVVQSVRFTDLKPSTAGNNQLTITVDGDRSLQYQVITEYYLPWASVPPTDTAQGVRIDVAYDRTELAVNDMVNVTATVELLAPGVAGTLLVDLGVPPGFTPVTADWDQLVAQGEIQRYEFTGRQILVYLTDVASGQPRAIPYRLQARFPIAAQVPSSQAYDYYTPEQQDTDAPQRIVVKLGVPEE